MSFQRQGSEEQVGDMQPNDNDNDSDSDSDASLCAWRVSVHGMACRSKGMDGTNACIACTTYRSMSINIASHQSLIVNQLLVLRYAISSSYPLSQQSRESDNRQSITLAPSNAQTKPRPVSTLGRHPIS